jgi:hypothetical protein
MLGAEANAGPYGSAQGAARKWDQEFESGFLQRGVYLSSAPRGCRRKAPHFGGGLRVAGDVRRDGLAAIRDSFALSLCLALMQSHLGKAQTVCSNAQAAAVGPRSGADLRVCD